MAARADARRPAAPSFPTVLAGEPDPGIDDTFPREWCTECGLPDAPVADGYPTGTNPPCPQCGSMWRWYGRLADRDGTATGPPPPATGATPTDCSECWTWQRHRPARFGWAWFRTCSFDCPHEHHANEVWFA